MAAIHDLLAQIQDEALRNRIEQEVDKLSKTKKFGLVFEEHLPECTPLYDMPIITGSNVMLRNSKEDKSLYVVVKIEDENAKCVKKENSKENITLALDDIVRVAEFGEPIYPYLKLIDLVCNAPESDLWHTLIEADNYHALQLLEYFYAGKVDCIYIDPPYNTGAKDWKYNNDYVDGNDTYRHSKWLSMIQKRLRIAKKLLNPNNSVLIVTIDEKEYLHLGCLLEELFPEGKIQMITAVINPKGRATNYFTRTDEYIYYVFLGDASVNLMSASEGEVEVRWPYLKRSDSDSTRGHRPRQFYPIYISDKTKKIFCIGEPISHEVNRLSVKDIEGCTTVFPVNEDGTEMEWGLTAPVLDKLNEQGFVRVGKKRNNNPMPYSLSYLSTADVKRVENGELHVEGTRDDGTKIVVSKSGKTTRMQTVWNSNIYDAGAYGKSLLGNMLPNRNFPFPKSLYATYDSLKYVVSDKPNALIIDFFAGSGTTLHAINLLNANDFGKRRCILVTNNETSDEEAIILKKNGLQPGDEEWNALGIARYITWPRTVCSIIGKDINGNSLTGNYLGSDLLLANGFKTNAAFYKLGFMNKTAVALGMQFKEMLPILWMKCGSVGKCPSLECDEIPDMLILLENKFAVLINENSFSEFKDALSNKQEIQTVFIITDYDINYRSMAKSLNVGTTYQLYRDYLDNFRINHGRN